MVKNVTARVPVTAMAANARIQRSTIPEEVNGFNTRSTDRKGTSAYFTI
jgi:hypothetical protein